MWFPLFFAALGAAILLAALWYGFITRRTVEKLDRMLSAALSGSFQESTYDETELSRLEQKMARFLSQSRLTTGAVETERNRVQSLIGDISHQTKTPLANILLYTQLLLEQPLPSTAQPLCTVIVSQAEKLQFLVGSLVKASRLESGVLQVHPARHSVQDLFLTLEQQYRPISEHREVELVVLPSDLHAQFDPKWTAEAVGNLIDNALKYTPAGGRVVVEAEDFPLFCRIRVRDNGPGISEEEHARVFERFYRSRDSTADGVGLGLYLARQVITAQGGYIRLQSTLGMGAEFSAYLPKDEP